MKKAIKIAVLLLAIALIVIGVFAGELYTTRLESSTL